MNTFVFLTYKVCLPIVNRIVVFDKEFIQREELTWSWRMPAR